MPRPMSEPLRLHYLAPGELPLEALEAVAARVLCDEEKARAARFVFSRDRVLFMAAHVLVRQLLSERTGQAAAQLRFEVGPHGKPELSQPGRTPALRFNLSHCDGLVACAVLDGHPVGVDVEHLDRRVAVESLAPRVLSGRELQGLEALGGEARRRRFLQLWTAKEAYVKALGDGLTLELRDLTVELDAASPAIVHAGADSATGPCQLSLWEPTPEHVMAAVVCAPEAPVVEMMPATIDAQ
ncbi:MAG: 4'-phosphopantetheinyl transferase superfamily protein [Myxococcales bacterium]|nr:4'-phosphopantetheinyl transferase superfamily protein [Myxococcales bacterium]